MQQILFASSNNQKFIIAKSACIPYGIKLIQQPAEIDEIQSEDPEYIVRDKANRAFEKLGQPVIVSDDCWSVPALNGFPGPYMKSLDYWFVPQNWIDLMHNQTDRRIILMQMLAYRDQSSCTVFRKDYTGYFLPGPKGNHGKPLQKVVTMPGDDGLSIAEVYETEVKHENRKAAEGWQAFASWYKGRYAADNNN